MLLCTAEEPAQAEAIVGGPSQARQHLHAVRHMLWRLHELLDGYEGHDEDGHLDEVENRLQPVLELPFLLLRVAKENLAQVPVVLRSVHTLPLPLVDSLDARQQVASLLRVRPGNNLARPKEERLNEQRVQYDR